jgi:hypothetical protein
VGGREENQVKRACSVITALGDWDPAHPNAQRTRVGSPGSPPQRAKDARWEPRQRGSRATVRKARFSTPALGCRSELLPAHLRES